MAAAPYEPSDEPEALWGDDLSDAQRAWLPTDGEQDLPWKNEYVTAFLDDRPVRVIEITNVAEPSWDGCKMACWVRALGPGWCVHLRHPGRVDLISLTASQTSAQTSASATDEIAGDTSPRRSASRETPATCRSSALK